MSGRSARNRTGRRHINIAYTAWRIPILGMHPGTTAPEIPLAQASEIAGRFNPFAHAGIKLSYRRFICIIHVEKNI